MRAAIAATVLLLAIFSEPALADVPQGHVETALGVWRSAATYSFYGPGFNGRRAADGSIYNQMAPTAAHRSWPFGTRVRVINPGNKRSEVVTITDRGPYIRGRVIDLSLGTARRLGLEHQGVGTVILEVLS